ncbi:MAG: M24 family metallopeptidase [Actinomycetota bacterium]
MTTFLLLDDALRSPEVRHEVGEPVMDPVGFIEHEGKRIVVGGVLERALFEAREDVVDEFWDVASFGRGDLVKDPTFPEANILPELVARALEKLGVSEAVVPASFHLLAGDYLRARGLRLVVDAEGWAHRRRVKTPAELEGTERAQRAAELAMLTAARMLRDAEPSGLGELRFEGELLTAEWIREAMVGELTTQGADCEQILVHSGDACLRGHDPGTGPILADRSCIIDCFPRDRRSGAHSDMTRTFVPGTPSDELVRLHARCREALSIAFDALRPGRSDAFGEVARFFASHGYPTQITHEDDGPLQEGFLHSLGHGVGLEVHEKPWMGRRSDELVAGDVVAVEPGLYFAGVGGVRLEDTVVVTEDGVEHFTDPYPYDLQP